MDDERLVTAGSLVGTRDGEAIDHTTHHCTIKGPDNHMGSLVELLEYWNRHEDVRSISKLAKTKERSGGKGHYLIDRTIKIEK